MTAPDPRPGRGLRAGWPALLGALLLAALLVGLVGYPVSYTHLTLPTICSV